MKKLLVFSLAFFFLLGLTAAYADQDDAVPVQAGKAKRPALIKKHGYLYPGRSEIVPLGSDRGDLPHGYLFNYDDEDAEYYLSGGIAGDEWGIWFQSAQAACSLYAVELTFYASIGGGTINLNVMEAGTVWPDTVPHGDSIAVADVFGANLMGTDEEFPLEIVATSDWEQFVFPDWGYDIDVGRDIFWIHWTKTGDAPMLLADDDNPGDYLRTWTYEPNQDGDWKWSHYGYSVGIEALVRCEVVFYEDPPPVVSNKQMWDTYDVGPHTLTATATDNALDLDSMGVESGTLYYEVNGGATQSVTATVTGDTSIGFTLTADIPAGAVGDEIKYWFDAVDKAGLVGYSLPLYFEITEPTNPTAKMLILDEGQAGYEPDLDGFDEVEFYIAAIEAAGYDSTDYEVWDTPAHHGWDESVVGYGWNTILAFAWGTYAIPTREYTDGFGAAMASFLDSGGNLLLADMDYFYGNNEVASPDFVAGDFAFDYFGIDAGENDPGAGADSVYTGVAGDLISGDFATTPVECQFYKAYNWADYVTPRSEATTIFTGESGNDGALRYTDGTFKTVYFGFNLANVDLDSADTVPESFKTIVGNFLTWAGPSGPAIDEHVSVLPVEFALHQNHPNPFNPVTNLKFDLPERADVKLVIYNLLGQKVTTLVNGELAAGYHNVVWNGRDQFGRLVGSGVYIYRITAGDYANSRKMLLLK